MDSATDASAALESVSRVRARTRMYRNGHWFASVVFGAVVVGALPFYVQSRPVRTRSHCSSLGHGVLACTGVIASASPFLGRAFEAPQPFSSLGNWSTLYWAIAIVVGFSAVIAYYHFQARRVGVQGRLWPAAVAGLVILSLVMWLNAGSNVGPADFWRRGTSALVVIALGLLVLSALERSRPFVVFALGFLGLALLSCLYDVENLLLRLGIGGPFRGGDNALANLVLPGAYLVVGGLLFFLARGRQLQVRVSLARTTP